MFFRPFEAVDIIKKGSERAFVLMMLAASALSSLAVMLAFFCASSIWAKDMMKGFQWSSWSYARYFIVLLVGIYIANTVRAALIHLVMRIFSEKGTLLDAFKVSTVNCFLMSAYLLLAVVIAAIPLVGMGLAVIVFTIGMLITVSVSLKALAVLYKTDIITSLIAVGIIMISVLCAVHLGLFATMPTKGLDGTYGYSFGGPRMMQQWENQGQGQFQYPYPAMMAPYFTRQAAPVVATPSATPAVVTPKPTAKKK